MARQKSTTLYPHPFSKAYWIDAASELKDVKMLVFAALMIAIRVAMKLLAIPLAPGLKINTAFIANAIGAMVYGPVMAALCAIVTDVLGFLQNPEGVYFVPFVLTEIAGSVFFALFLYRAKVTPVRVMLARFCICFIVNVVIQTPIMLWYYALFMQGKTYALTIPGIIKNLFMFPIESVVLTFILSVIVPITNRLGLTYTGGGAKEALRFSKKQIALLAILVVVGVGATGGYLTYYYNNTSLSASYKDQEGLRAEKNKLMLQYLKESTDSMDDQELLTVVTSEKQKFLGKNATYTVDIYRVKEGEATEKMWNYSLTPAKKDENLEKLGTATVVAVKNGGTLISFDMDPVS